MPSVEAGLDMEMPGPPRKRGKNLADGVRKGFMTEASLDINVRRVLELVSAPQLPAGTCHRHHAASHGPV